MILDVHITTRCNLRCKHCYLRLKEDRRDIDLDLFADLLIDASLHGVRTFILSGGEPLIHRNFPELLDAYRLYYGSLAMATNGTLISDYIDLFSPEDRGIQISLDGDKEFHDWLRGDGTYDAVIQAIEELREKKITPSIAFTVSQENFHCVDHIIDLCKRYGIKYVNVNMYMPLIDSELTPLTLKQFFEVRKKFRVAGIRVSEPCYLKQCIAGVGVLSILPDGKVWACSRHRSIIGDLTEQRLGEIKAENDGNQFKTCMKNLPMPETLKQIEREIIQRLKHFKNVSPKFVVYGGDFGGDLLIHYLDVVYGKDGYTIYASLLPCYPEELKEYVKRKLDGRKNVVFVDCGDKCSIRVENGVLVDGACTKVTRMHENSAGLELCGCFHPDGTLEKFLEYWKEYTEKNGIKGEFNGYWTRKRVNGKERVNVYLFGGLHHQLCQLLYFWHTKENPCWEWWRVMVCEHLEEVDRMNAENREKLKEKPITPDRFVMMLAEVS